MKIKKNTIESIITVIVLTIWVSALVILFINYNTLNNNYNDLKESVEKLVEEENSYDYLQGIDHGKVTIYNKESNEVIFDYEGDLHINENASDGIYISITGNLKE